jgi:hypothetical protein
MPRSQIKGDNPPTRWKSVPSVPRPANIGDFECGDPSQRTSEMGRIRPKGKLRGIGDGGADHRQRLPTTIGSRPGALPAHGTLSGTQKMISGPETSQGWMHVKELLVRGQLSLVRRKDHICWTTDWSSAARQINNLLPTCGNIAPAHVCRFSTPGAKCLVSLAYLVK